jgi:hypothetical protein
MSGRGVTTFIEIEGLVARLARMDEPAAIEALRRFAREMQARGVEHAAACTDRGPREYLLREAARIREGQS